MNDYGIKAGFVGQRSLQSQPTGGNCTDVLWELLRTLGLFAEVCGILELVGGKHFPRKIG
jgi:hypothetical protein